MTATTPSTETASAIPIAKSWTLRRKLVAGMSALLAAALIVTGVTTVLALRSFAFERLDAQVLEGLDLVMGGPGGGQDRGGPAGAGPAPDGSGGQQFDGLQSEGQQPDGSAPPAMDGVADAPSPRIGSLQAVVAADGEVVSSSYTQSDGTQTELSDEQIDSLLSAVVEDRRPATVQLGGEIGTFRVAAATVGGQRVIAGNSTQDITATTAASIVIFAIAGGVILAASIVGGLVFVRRSLRPLDRVAGVATRVSGRPLAAGEVEIPDRVGAEDTDPGTEVGRVGASLNELLGHVEASLAARQLSEDRLRRFIADASHELRTPLASIRGYAQLSLREDAPMTQTQRRSLDRIDSESERMSALVDDLLLLARLDSGQRLNVGTVELTMLAVDAVSDAHAADPSREWRLDVSEELVEVPGDENRIRQVLANLLRNARTHTPPGTIVVTSLSQDDADAILRVADDGPGIDPSVQHRLFERFARGDEARNRDAGSTGLGLSIAHAITVAHHGAIEVESAPGRTVFTVRLPLRRADEA